MKAAQLGEARLEVCERLAYLVQVGLLAIGGPGIGASAAATVETAGAAFTESLEQFVRLIQPSDAGGQVEAALATMRAVEQLTEVIRLTRADLEELAGVVAGYGQRLRNLEAVGASHISPPAPDDALARRRSDPANAEPRRDR